MAPPRTQETANGSGAQRPPPRPHSMQGAPGTYAVPAQGRRRVGEAPAHAPARASVVPATGPPPHLRQASSPGSYLHPTLSPVQADYGYLGPASPRPVQRAQQARGAPARGSYGSPTPSQETPRHRILIQATLDNEHFSVVNVTGLASAHAIKTAILHKLQPMHQDPARWGLAQTEIGHPSGQPLPWVNDNTLLALCLQMGDDKGTVKFLVQVLPSTPHPHDAPRAPSNYVGTPPRYSAPLAPGSAPGASPLPVTVRRGPGGTGPPVHKRRPDPRLAAFQFPPQQLQPGRPVPPLRSGPPASPYAPASLQPSNPATLRQAAPPAGAPRGSADISAHFSPSPPAAVQTLTAGPERSTSYPRAHDRDTSVGSGDEERAGAPRPLPSIPSPRTPRSGQDHSASSSSTTPLSSYSEEDDRVASVQRLVDKVQLSHERPTSTFGSFSDDTLGGTFAQSLDAATLQESDVPRLERSAMDAGVRPVLTLSISPPHSASEHSEVQRTGSFAAHGRSWALRPPEEQLYEQLDDLFPRHDLDKPLAEGGIPPSTPSPRAPHGLTRGQHHSIRVIAQNRRRQLEHGAEAQRAPALRDGAGLDRRRSTKLWGGRMVEMRTHGTESVGVVPDSANGTDVEPSRRRVFKWVKGDLIGKGTYGRVYLALNATTGEMIAVKQVELPQTQADRASSRQRGVVAALRSEIQTLKELDHPNVVTCLGFEQTLDTLSIFLEYVPGGSIGSCLRKHGKFDEDTVRWFLHQTLRGLSYLHKQGILHRDLKADNLLVDYKGTCKISDFGTVRHSENIYGNVPEMSLQGSIFWMAPEMMSISPSGYSAKIDIWSLGCVVLEMLAGRRPWSDEEAVQAMFKIGAERRAPPVPADCHPSRPALHFLRNCFEIDPDTRPTAARLLEHVYAWPSPEYTFAHSALYEALHP